MISLTSLISYWKLDEASGNALDAHGSNPCTEENGVASGAGKINTSRTFVAANSEDFVHASNASLQTGDIDFTVGVWVNPGNITTLQTLMSKWGDGTNKEWGLFLNGVGDGIGDYGFILVDAAQNQTTVRATDPTDPIPAIGVWDFIVAWHNAAANTLNIQVNNGVVNSVSYSAGTVVGNAPFRLGALGDTPDIFFSGSLDEAFFAKRVFDATDRTALYNSGAGFAYAWGNAVAAGFDGIIPLGFYSLMPTWSGAGVVPGGAALDVWRASYAIYHQRGG